MTKLILTRYLYLFDEVALSFISSLLAKYQLKECYFWISELYLSGFQDKSWELLWFIYYDFYFVLNPYFYKFIEKNFLKNDMKSLLSVVKNLHRLNTSNDVFIYRQYNSNVKTIDYLFKGRKPGWCSKINSQYYALFRYIDKKLYHFAVASLPESIDENIFESITTYFDHDTFTNNIDYFKNIFNDSYYNNQAHKVWSIISLLIFNKEFKLTKNKIYITLTTDEYDFVDNIHNEPIPLTKNNNPQIYKTLVYKRLYNIHDSCSSFQLLRENVENIEKILWYHWEYYAYYCPLWKSRFDKYDITIDHEKEKITFNDDEELETFYEDYCYDPDELSFEAQNKILINMPENNWSYWNNKLFNKSSYNFKPDFKFYY